MLHNQFLVSGDACGFVKVFDVSNFGVLLDGVCKPLPASHQPAVTSLDILEKPATQGPLVVVGDSLGNITLLKKDVATNSVQQVTFGAHADKKPNEVQRVLKLPGSLDLVSVGANGLVRLWTGASQ